MLLALRRKAIHGIRFSSGKCGQNLSGSTIGPKFTSDKEVEEFLSKSTWDVREYVPSSVDEKLIPSEETVVRLLKISGLPIKNIDQIQIRLANQLSFINRLHNLPVDENITKPCKNYRKEFNSVGLRGINQRDCKPAEIGLIGRNKRIMGSYQNRCSEKRWVFHLKGRPT